MNNKENLLIFEAYIDSQVKRVRINNEDFMFYYPRSDFRLTSWLNGMEHQTGTTQEILTSFFRKVEKLGFHIKSVVQNSFRIIQ